MECKKLVESFETKKVEEDSMTWYTRELFIPECARGLVVGKNHSNLNKYKDLEGIAKVHMSTQGKLTIQGLVEEEVIKAFNSVKSLVVRANGFLPEFQVFCFCASLRNPSHTLKNLVFKGGDTFVYFQGGEFMTQSNGTTSENGHEKSDNHNNALFLANWNSSSYISEIVRCLQSVRTRGDLAGIVKLVVRFGKQSFHGPSAHDVVKEGVSCVGDMKSLYTTKGLKGRFQNGCDRSCVESLKAWLDMDDEVGFVKVSEDSKVTVEAYDSTNKFKISMRSKRKPDNNLEVERVMNALDHFQVLGVERDANMEEISKAYRRCAVRLRFRVANADFAEMAEQLVFQAFNCLANTTLRSQHLSILTQNSPAPKFHEDHCDNDEDNELRISRVRRMPRRHGFVTFCRAGGPSTTDFRLGILSHANMDISEDMKSWLKEAWNNDKFAFTKDKDKDSDRQYHAIGVRYKKFETYVTEELKLRIGWVKEENFDFGYVSEKLECTLSSRCFKSNGKDGACEEDLQADIEHLVKHAAMISAAMDKNNKE